MANFQLDYEEIVQSESDIFNLINRYKSSNFRKMCIENKSYYDGENWTITHLPERKYWCDRVLKDNNGNTVYDNENRPKRVNAMITNPFVANNRVAYGIFHDIVSQKVNTLLHEIPYINTTHKIEDNYREQFGYALKNAGIEASICSKSFIYEDNDGNFTVFDTADCIPFYDNQTGILRLLIRFFIKQGEFSKKRSTIAEVYTEDGLIVYEKKGNVITKLSETPYKFIRSTSIILSKVKGISLSKLPIIEFRNNKEEKSDLTPSIRAKIDVIDAVQSGFINNIEDFSDVFWVIKKMPNGAMDEDDYADFFANINKTKKLFVEEATPEQFNIPHEARSKAVEMLKQQIAEESGVIDTERLQATQLTNVAIKASTMKLEQRVSDFEWFANETARALVNIYQEYNGIKFDFEIDFTKLLVINTGEMIDNLLKVRNDISQRTFLENLKKLGMFVDDVDEELERLAEERENQVSIFEEPQGDGDGVGSI